MNPGDLIVAVGGFKHINECREPLLSSTTHDSCRVERWPAKLYPGMSDWGTPMRFDHGTLGLVLSRFGPTGSGREWRRIMAIAKTGVYFGWMCPGDGWKLA